MKDILHVTFISHSMILIVVTYSFYINLYLMQLLATVYQDCKNPKKLLVLYNSIPWRNQFSTIILSWIRNGPWRGIIEKTLPSLMKLYRNLVFCLTQKDSNLRKILFREETRLHLSSLSGKFTGTKNTKMQNSRIWNLAWLHKVFSRSKLHSFY